MSAIVWLASYPKSGNTWLRILLSNYLHHDDEPADINQLESELSYIARNPLDVAVSCAYHWGTSVEQAVQKICDPGHCMNAGNRRLTDQTRQFLGSWSSHARSWLDQSGLPCHVLRYEDLHRDPERAGRLLPPRRSRELAR